VSARLLKHPLQSHPASPPPPDLRVEVQRLAPDDPLRPLRLCFELHADPAALRLPAPLASGAPTRTDGLWRHTCFEAFLAAPAPSATSTTAGADTGSDTGQVRVPYVEYNLAPSGAWAAYRFDGYRAGMRPEPLVVEPRVVASLSGRVLRFDVALAWPTPLPGAPPEAHDAPTAAAGGTRWQGRLGLSAVIEAADGKLSYWALHHPAALADFHNGEGFTLGVEVAA
jgi:hypothetical protein